jgi:(E)-4-hydroxy-3-methylbut-2-enyl-diphosphate synthase
LGLVAHYETWKSFYKNRKHCFPIFTTFPNNSEEMHPQLNFLGWDANCLEIDELKTLKNTVLVLSSSRGDYVQSVRKFFVTLLSKKVNIPVILQHHTETKDHELFQLSHSAHLGALLIDGFGDGVWLKSTERLPLTLLNSTSFGILQATRTRISKTEYISCPSCGRTLFDLQETTAKIRKSTAHLKGIKIGIMGCIVNGPGEMADADYGYVGTRPGKIHLYKEKTVIKKNVPEAEAVHELIELIKSYGDWVEPIAK